MLGTEKKHRTSKTPTLDEIVVLTNKDQCPYIDMYFKNIGLKAYISEVKPPYKLYSHKSQQARIGT